MENGHTFTLHRPDIAQISMNAMMEQEEMKDHELNNDEKEAFLRILQVLKWDNEDIIKEVLATLESLNFSQKSISKFLSRIYIGEALNPMIQIINIHCPLLYKEPTKNVKLFLIMAPLNNYVRIRLIKHFYSRQWVMKFNSDSEKINFYNMRPFLEDQYMRYPPPVGKLSKAIAYQIRDFYQNLKLKESALCYATFQMQLCGDTESFERRTLIFALDVPQVCASNISLSLYTLMNQNYRQELLEYKTLKYRICSIIDGRTSETDEWNERLKLMSYQMQYVNQDEDDSAFMY